MGSAYKKIIGLGVSAILIPLAKWALGKCAERVKDRLISKSGAGDTYIRSIEEDTTEYETKRTF